MAELKDVLAALGIAEDADPVAAIANMRADIASLRETIAGNKPTADAARLAELERDLAETRGKLIIEQSENARKIAAIEAEARRDKVAARVDRAIASGKPPAMREQLLEYGMSVTTEKFEEFLQTIPSIDLTERGVATGHELAALEPTTADIETAKALGNWDESKPTESKLRIMRQKAERSGMSLPPDYTGAA